MSSKNFIFLGGMCKTVVTISKEAWKKCDIETIYHYNEEKNVLELLLKMGDTEINLDHSNLCDVVLKRIRKIHGRKRKYITDEGERKNM